MSAITKTDKQRHIEGELRAKAAQEKLSAKLAVKRKEKLTAIQAEGKQNKKHACKHCDGTYFKHRIGAHMINNHDQILIDALLIPPPPLSNMIDISTQRKLTPAGWLQIGNNPRSA